MVHFSVMDYSLSDENVKEHWDMPRLADHWHFPQFHKTVIPYVIASNCEEVRLYLNEKRIYVPKPSACANQMCIRDRALVMQTPGNIPTSDIIGVYVYNVGLGSGQFSYTAAIGLFINIINFILIVSVNQLSKRMTDVGLF